MKEINNKTKIRTKDLVLYKSPEMGEYCFAVISKEDKTKLYIPSKDKIVSDFNSKDLFSYVAERIIGAYDDVINDTLCEIGYFFKLMINDEFHALVNRSSYDKFPAKLKYFKKVFYDNAYITLKDLVKAEKDLNKYYFAKREKKQEQEENVLEF